MSATPSTTATRREYKRISELQVGDIVLDHGMRLLVDRPLEISKSHSLGSDGSHCRYTQALVLNRDDPATSAVPHAWTADWKRDGKYEARPHDGEHRWTIQSNDLMTWCVEVTVEENVDEPTVEQLMAEREAIITADRTGLTVAQVKTINRLEADHNRAVDSVAVEGRWNLDPFMVETDSQLGMPRVFWIDSEHGHDYTAAVRPDGSLLP